MSMNTFFERGYFKTLSLVTVSSPKLTTDCATQQLSNEWSDLRVLSIESKADKLCITQGLTLGIKRVINVKMDKLSVA